MLDPNFMHSVVLMCRHDSEGAFGLVVNRPSPITVDRLLPEHPLLGKSSFPVHVGGPVGRDTLQFMHREPEIIHGGEHLAGEIFLGGELDAMADLIAIDEEEARAKLRLIVGYSGWGAGQLDAELATGSWLPAPLGTGFAFGEGDEAIWRRVVRSIGKRAHGMENLPPDVSWN